MHWLLNLLCVKRFNARLKEEESQQIAFANYCRAKSIQGELNAVWTAISNEYSGRYSPLFGAKLCALGKISGAPDMMFIWSGGGGLIEFKSSKGRLSEKQKLFQKWCQVNNVNHELVRSSDEAIEVIKKWGLVS